MTLLAIGAATAYTIANFAMNTDSSALLSPELPWRQREMRLEKVFPGRSDVTLVLIDAVTPELAELAATQLNERLAAKPHLFRSVRRPDGGPFFERHGFLYLETAELRQTLERLIAAQPLLGTIALDPSARGLFETLSLTLEGVRRGEAAPDAMAPVLTALDTTVEGVLAGRFVAFSLQSLLLGREAAAALRRVILVQPVLDYTALMPGAAATDAIRAEARSLGLDADHGVRLRLTGDIPLADEELQTLADDAGLNVTMTALSLIVLLWLAVRSLRIVAAILLTLAAGLVLTAATGLIAFGAFNMISMAFAVLFVGLGVDFCIQFAVSYRAHLDAETRATVALARAARQIGRPLALAAASTALGFLAFLPTEYRGLSELGAIAGTGMLIAFSLTITFLPALLRVIGSAAAARPMAYATFARRAPVRASSFRTARRRTPECARRPGPSALPSQGPSQTVRSRAQQATFCDARGVPVAVSDLSIVRTYAFPMLMHSRAHYNPAVRRHACRSTSVS